jgi:Asp-tRNA(Asn)/Glu-tRNA(Gln) amidotransferase C subunit
MNIDNEEKAALERLSLNGLSECATVATATALERVTEVLIIIICGCPQRGEAWH